jgi:hypothetical protein
VALFFLAVMPAQAGTFNQYDTQSGTNPNGNYTSKFLAIE